DAHLGTPVAQRAAVIVDEPGRVRQATFAELADRTSRFAQLLRDVGVGAGERMLIRLPNSLEYPVVFLGAMKRGAVPVPTSILLTAEEVVYLAGDSGARAVFPAAAIGHAARRTLGCLAHVSRARGVVAGVGPPRRRHP